MVLIDPNLINQQINLLGEMVTITVKSGKTYSDWGDQSSTETDTTGVKAIFNVYGKRSVFESEGDFQEGDITFFFRSDQSGIENGTVVTRANGDTYQIEDPRDHGIQGSSYVNEAIVKQI